MFFGYLSIFLNCIQTVNIILNRIHKAAILALPPAELFILLQISWNRLENVDREFYL
jgi:hypothetical protein